jgi:hypothetical protein
MINSSLFRFLFLVLVFAAVVGASVSAQEKSSYRTREFCSNNNWSYGDKVSFRELREVTVPASGLINVDGRRNGGIRVTGENRSDILIRACVQAWADSEGEAQKLAKNVRVETGAVIRATGDESNQSVSYEIRVPRKTNLKLTANNGGIGISSVEGTINFETMNGGVHLDEVAGNVKGRTTNGGVHVELSGGSWKGSGLDVETTNGGVNLSIPENYAARFETQTTNGGFKSEISSLQEERKRDDNRYYYGRHGVKISKDINGGGAPVRLITTNGGVRINAR